MRIRIQGDSICYCRVQGPKLKRIRRIQFFGFETHSNKINCRRNTSNNEIQIDIYKEIQSFEQFWHIIDEHSPYRLPITSINYYVKPLRESGNAKFLWPPFNRTSENRQNSYDPRDSYTP